MQNEKWPFHDESSGVTIQESRFYGFGDAGGLTGGCSGFATRAEAIDSITKEYELEESEIGTKPSDLGSYGTTVLSGREFIDQLYVICKDGGGLGDISEYGHWSP